MVDRQSLRRDFVMRAGWAEATIADLAGDASHRRYLRLTHKDARAVLMDAPPEKGEDVGAFVDVAGHLRDKGMSAPEILAEDRDAGFLLLEDLGDDLFARVLETAPAQEETLYQAATDVLISLHSEAAPAHLDVYDASHMADLAALAFDWYASGVADRDFTTIRAEFADGFAKSLDALDGLSEVLIQRDYHAENLLWLPEREGIARVGLLDFQDAMAGHRAYDLVSLLQDARRDVSQELEARMIAHYLKATALDRCAFEEAYALLGLQRNLRILGVFARLCLRDSKAHYLALLPRVWGHVLRDLEKAQMSASMNDLIAHLPAPDESALNNLRQKCGTIQQQ